MKEMTAASVGSAVRIGLSHRRCEDRAAARVFPNGCVIALADGVSTAQFGAEAAELSVRIAIEAAGETILPGWKGSPSAVGEASERILAHVSEALRMASDESGSNPAEWASTLLLAVLPADGDSFWLHCGDGVILGVDTGRPGFSRPGFISAGIRLPGNRIIPTSLLSEYPGAYRSGVLKGRTSLLLSSDGLGGLLTAGSRGKRPKPSQFGEDLITGCAFSMLAEPSVRGVQPLLENLFLHMVQDDDISVATFADGNDAFSIIRSCPDIRARCFPLPIPERAPAQARQELRRAKAMLDLSAEQGITPKDLDRKLYLHGHLQKAKAQIERYEAAHLIHKMPDRAAWFV